MKKHDASSATLWVLFGLYISFEGYRLGLGTPGNPGCGFFVFGAADYSIQSIGRKNADSPAFDYFYESIAPDFIILAHTNSFNA